MNAPAPDARQGPRPRAARPIRSVAVLVPVRDGLPLLERQLAALRAQVLELPWELRIVDSSSTDGSWELCRAQAQDFPVPFALERIHPDEFDHGDTRNRLTARTQADLCVFLTQDALPLGSDWLARLTANFADPEVGAAYCRNVPRPSADAVARIWMHGDPCYALGRREVRVPPPAEYARLDAHARRELWTFNDVASAVRRELWELCPFARTSFGEDVLLARALLEAGWTVVYDDRAAVEHSHEYTPEQARARAEMDGRFSAEWLGRVCIASRADAAIQSERQAPLDAALFAAEGLAGAELTAARARARALRSATFEGLWQGGRARRRRRGVRMLERRELDVLYVVHAFPPDTWAGTEIYTLNLARAMAARGHRVSVLARCAPSPEDPRELELRESEFAGLRVLRLPHALEFASLRESFSEPRIEQLFRDLLARERPDVVHFQHLIHLSAGLVGIACDAGLATLLHLHDYWGLCARVQLVRPDGVLCPDNRGLGCLWCVKEKRYAQIPLLERAGPWIAPFARAANRLVHGARTRERKRRTGLQRALADYTDVVARPDVVLGSFARADLCISPSRFLRQKLLATGRFDPERVIYSPNGSSFAHLERRAKTPDPSGRLRVGFIGSLVWYKGAHVLVEAVAELAREGAPIACAIHGEFAPERDAYHAELARNARAAAGALTFAGRFDNARLSEIHAELDVLVVPSLWYENAPVTIQEAWAAGTPVVASRLGGMAEAIEDGQNGLLFAAGDAAELARALARLAREPGLGPRLAAAAPQQKTVLEDAADSEYRYRALVARRPERGA